MPELSFPLAMAGCFVSCSAYAIVLTTKGGQRATLDHIWIAGFVVLGVSIVLAWIATQGAHGALTDLAFFAAGGLPMLIRAGYLWQMHQREYVNHLRQRAERNEGAGGE